MRDDQEEQDVGANFATPFSAKAEEDAKRFNIAGPAVAKPTVHAGCAAAGTPRRSRRNRRSRPRRRPERRSICRRATPLQVALETDEKLDAKAVVAHVNKLAGVKACALMFGDGLSLAGSLPAEYETDGLCAMAPSLMQRIENHMVETKLGALRGMTLACAKGAITFFMHENLCLAALHASDELAPEVREKLARIVHELSRKYSPPGLGGLLMSIINYASREIQFKIVYYGPALCGKTTNLGYIHQRINPENRGDLVSLATAADRTLFFDFLPLNAVVIKGFVTKFQLYTVPGQVIYNATRQLVLRSVDGMIFVADSQWEKMEENVESFKNLEDNLAKQNISIDEIPYVLQYNKRDLDNIAPVNYLEYVLNNRKRRVQSFEVISSTGQNVFASLNAVSQILLHKFSKQSDVPKTAPAPVAIPVEPPVAQKQSATV